MSDKTMTDTNTTKLEPSKTPEQLEQEKILHYTTTFQKLQLIDLENYLHRNRESLIGTYKKEDLQKYMQAPELDASQKVLRKISKFLFNASPQYSLAIGYYASILTLDYMIKPTSQNPKKIKKKEYENSYYKFVNFVENMNVQHEFSRILDVVYRDGVYYGYVFQDKNDFFFFQLDSDYCKITYVDRGMYFLSFNLTYFHVYPERLLMYPKEFQDEYEKIKSNIKNKRNAFWFQVDSAKSICIKTDESNWYSIPPLANTFESALNINDFKALDIAEAEIGNYKLLFQRIPIDTKEGSENRFLLTPDFVQTFHDNIETGLPKQVGLMTSPMEITDISFDKDSVDRNKVADSTSQYWSDTGISQLLFSSNGKTSPSSLAKAIMADEAKAFKMLYQFERWLGIYLFQFFPDRFFKVELPKITNYNKEEFLKNAKEAATYGFPVRRLINAALGNDPSSMYMDVYLENEILDLPNKFIPMSSSHTSSGDPNNKGGRPSGAKPVGESGDKTIENDSNNPDARV
jgi:hypothetical protein